MFEPCASEAGRLFSRHPCGTLEPLATRGDVFGGFGGELGVKDERMQGGTLEKARGFFGKLIIAQSSLSSVCCGARRITSICLVTDVALFGCWKSPDPRPLFWAWWRRWSGPRVFDSEVRLSWDPADLTEEDSFSPGKPEVSPPPWSGSRGYGIYLGSGEAPPLSHPASHL